MNIFASAFILEPVFLQVCLLLYAMELVIISIWKEGILSNSPEHLRGKEIEL